MLNIMAAFCEKPAVVLQRTTTCQRGSICCDNTRTPQTSKPRPTTRRTTTTTTPAPTTVAPNLRDQREECPGTCIVPLLSFTCFKNAEISELFKCKKSGTQCCAPKSKIQEMADRHNRFNYTYPYNPNLGPLNPNYPHPVSAYYSNYPPPPQPSQPNYPPPPPYHQNPNPYPQQPHPFDPTQSAQPSNQYEVVDQTTSSRPPPYSKYVCGVKGTIRTAKTYAVIEGNSTEPSTQRRKRQITNATSENITINKSSERLVLGSSIIPIPIIYDDNTTFSLAETTSTNYRRGRVVGGEDGDNGEWCWQVALINSQNQYLCGGALIGKLNCYTENHPLI